MGPQEGQAGAERLPAAGETPAIRQALMPVISGCTQRPGHTHPTVSPHSRSLGKGGLGGLRWGSGEGKS